ncbi:hypothetical protein Q31b_58150 [Novipirellula aureliae]|uniref:Uncharacterized protein n=1 Tax=Novipirellula aureliae TaxID=2527966 RepID=A0A5C6D777_9BACT|nr:hypothetical protein Q31b_58150 [Novipirellula aureliae]
MFRTKTEMTNPYTPAAPASHDTHPRDRYIIAFLLSVVLASTIAITGGTDIFRAAHYAITTGDTGGLANVWTSPILIAVTFFFVYSEWTANSSLLRLTSILLVPYFAFCVYSAFSLSTVGLDFIVARIRDNALTLIGLAWIPVTFAYAFIVVYRSRSSTTSGESG